MRMLVPKESSMTSDDYVERACMLGNAEACLAAMKVVPKKRDAFLKRYKEIMKPLSVQFGKTHE
ncbi:hypothetical protein ACOME3_006510 [Neoechinorhynchus agilis]